MERGLSLTASKCPKKGLVPGREVEAQFYLLHLADIVSSSRKGTRMMEDLTGRPKNFEFPVFSAYPVVLYIAPKASSCASLSAREHDESRHGRGAANRDTVSHRKGMTSGRMDGRVPVSKRWDLEAEF